MHYVLQTERNSDAAITRYLLTECGEWEHSRIVGGTETDPNEYPWVVALAYISDGQYRVFCGATLVTNSFVMTAAHCVQA